MTSAGERRIWSRALLFAAVVTALPLFAGRFLPFSDLPEHVAAIGTLRHWFDPAYRISEHYTLAWGRSQYLVYHFAGAGLAHLTGSAESANRMLLVLVAVAYPYGMRSLLRAFGRDERLALFACPLFWNHALVYGLLPFVASVPLVLFGLAAIVRQVRAPIRRRSVALAIFGLLLVLLHVSAFLVFAVAGVVLTVCLDVDAETPWRRAFATLPMRIAWLAPSAAVAIVWAAVSNVGLHGESLRRPGQIVYSRASTLSRGFAIWSQDIWRSHVDEALAVAFWVLVAAIAVDALVRARPHARPSAARRSLARWVPLGVVLGLYLFLPFRIGAADSLNVRMGLFIPLFVLVGLEARRGRLVDVALAGAVVLTVGGSLNDAYQVHESQRELGDFDRVLAAMGTGKRVVALDFVAGSERAHVAPWVHAAAYHQARSGGVGGPSFSVLGHWPIQFRPEAAPPAKSEDFWELSPCLFRNATDGVYFDYVLVRGPVDPFRDAPPGPVWEVVLREADWTLYTKLADSWIPDRGDADHGPCTGQRQLARSR